MHDEGLINEEEFNKKKTEILESSNPNAALATFANTPAEKEFAIENCWHKFYCGPLGLLHPECRAYQKIKLHKDDIELEETFPCPWCILFVPTCIFLITTAPMVEYAPSLAILNGIMACCICCPVFCCYAGSKSSVRKPYSNFGRPYREKHSTYYSRRYVGLPQQDDVGLRHLEDIQVEYNKLGGLDSICQQGANAVSAVSGVFSVRGADGTIPDLISKFGNKKQAFKGQKIYFEGTKAKMLEMCNEISKRISIARNKERNELFAV
jgi:hypothetical protein